MFVKYPPHGECYLNDVFINFIEDYCRFIEPNIRFSRNKNMSLKAVDFQRKLFISLVLLFIGVATVQSQSKSLLTCLEPSLVEPSEYEQLQSIGPRNFEIDNSKISSIDYIDSLLKLPFQSELDIIDSTFNLADSCIQFMRKGVGGGVSSYYAYSLGVVKDDENRDVIEIFLHYRNIFPHNVKGEQMLGVSFYRLIDDRILTEPIIRLHTFKKTYDIPL